MRNSMNVEDRPKKRRNEMVHEEKIRGQSFHFLKHELLTDYFEY